MAAFLIVIGEALSEDHKTLILNELAKGLKCVNLVNVGVDINEELAKIANRADVGEEGPDDEHIIQYTSDKFGAEILIHPHIQTLQNALKNLLTSAAEVKHLLFAGQYVGGSGSWVLQDDLFSIAKLAHVFKVSEEEIKQQNGCKFTISCNTEGEWKSSTISKFGACKNWTVEINPAECVLSANGILQFSAYISNFLRTKTVGELLRTSDVVGNIRFSKPTLYIFPGSEGDSSLFGISGFNLLVNGGFKRRSCFWDFCRHLDRIDAVLMTHLGTDNIFGVSSVLQRKNQEDIHPEIGYVYLNAIDKAVSNTANQTTSKDLSLSLSLTDEGNKIIELSKQLGLVPHPCTRSGTSKDLHPINLYHKVGHGSLDMYILNPVTDSKELKDFYQQWNKQVADFTSVQNVSLPNILSVCSLLIWKPANPTEKICRIFFPGNAPQHKVLEGLEKLKQLEVLKHANCTGQSLHQAKNSPKKPASGTSRPLSARKDKPSKPASSESQKKMDAKETAKPQKPKLPSTLRTAKNTKEDENKLKVEDKGSKGKTATTKPSPTKPSKSTTPKKTSPVEKLHPVINSVPEKAAKEDLKMEKPEPVVSEPVVSEPVKSEPVVPNDVAPEAPKQEPLVDLLAMEGEKVAAAVKAAEEALQQSVTEPVDGKSESPEPLPDPAHYNSESAVKEPAEIIPQDQFEPSPDDSGFQNQKFDAPLQNGGSLDEHLFHDRHSEDSGNIVPESLPEPVAYSPNEPDLIPEVDILKEPTVQETMVPPSVTHSEPDVVPKDEELQNVEDQQHGFSNVGMTDEEKVVCENVVNGVLDNLDDDGIMYDDEEEEEVEDELEKDAATEKDLEMEQGSKLDEKSTEMEKDLDLDEKDVEMEKESMVDERVLEMENGSNLEEKQAETERELMVDERATEMEKKSKFDDLPIMGFETQGVDLLQEVSVAKEQEASQTEEPEQEMISVSEETSAQKEHSISKERTEIATDVVEEFEGTAAESFSGVAVERHPEEPEQKEDVTDVDVLKSKDDEEDQEEEFSPDEGDSQTGEPRDSLSPEPIEQPSDEQRDSLSPEPVESQTVERGSLSPELLEQQGVGQRDSLSPEPVEQQTVERGSLSAEPVGQQGVEQRDSLSPEPFEKQDDDEDGHLKSEDVKTYIEPQDVEEKAEVPDKTNVEGATQALTTSEEDELKEYERQIDEEIQNLQETNGDFTEGSNIPEAFEKDETPDPKDLLTQQDMEQQDPVVGSEDSSDSDDVMDYEGGNTNINPFGEVSHPQVNGTQPAYNPFEGLDQGVENPSEEVIQGQTFYGKDKMESHQQNEPSLHEPVPEPWDPETEWGQPMGLPSPPPPEDTASGDTVKQNGKSPTSKTSPKSKPTTKTTEAKRPDSARTAAKKGPATSTTTKTKASTLNTSRTEKPNTSRRPASAAEPKTKPATSRRPATATGNTRSSPLVSKMPPLPPFTAFYVDLTYIPYHGDPHYSNIDFFKRIRARYYVLSSLSPNIKTLDALLDAKETWEDKELQVTIIPTYDNEKLRHWMGLNKDRLSCLNIDLAPSASRCTIQLQDHETSCSAYRLEF